jgi:hypothetical protein
MLIVCPGRISEVPEPFVAVAKRHSDAFGLLARVYFPFTITVSPVLRLGELALTPVMVMESPFLKNLTPTVMGMLLCGGVVSENTDAAHRVQKDVMTVAANFILSSPFLSRVAPIARLSGLSSFLYFPFFSKAFFGTPPG